MVGIQIFKVTSLNDSLSIRDEKIIIGIDAGTLYRLRKPEQ